MKKLIIAVCLCTSMLLTAYSKRDLKDTICNIDVAAVKEILSCEQLTPREQTCYLTIAENIIREREAWLRELRPVNGSWAYKKLIPRDVTTPYENNYYESYLLKLSLGSLAYGIFAIALTIAIEKHFREHENISKRKLIGLGAGVCGGLCLILSAYKDDCKAEQYDKDYEKLLRKKYEDAVAIKEAIFLADVIEG